VLDVRLPVNASTVYSVHHKLSVINIKINYIGFFGIAVAVSAMMTLIFSNDYTFYEVQIYLEVTIRLFRVIQ
jgi:hypothetical protein